MTTILTLLLLVSSYLFLVYVCVAMTSKEVSSIAVPKGSNPFTPKAFMLRYWDTHISNDLPKPAFLISKASPLNHYDSAFLTSLASQDKLATHFSSFCSLANLCCSFDSPSSSLNIQDSSNQQITKDANFATYTNRNFADYGTSRVSGIDSFKNYSNGLNTPNDSFKKYSTSTIRHGEQFTNYAENGNVATNNFTSYGTSAASGSGGFNNYDKLLNVPNLRFVSYDSGANNHELSFSSYGNETNSGSQSFSSYGKNGKNNPSDFNNYGISTNILQSQFTSYGELANSANDSFKGYGSSGNNPHSNFRSYGVGSNFGTDSFSGYRDGANVGDDSFQTYGRNSNSGTVSFANYGKSFNLGNDSFKEYGKGSSVRTAIGFKTYSLRRTFKDYAKKGISFAEYNNFSTVSDNLVNTRVEPGKFFRESMLKEGNIMMMPDIKDKLPVRSFLPRSISTKLPFSSSKLDKLMKIFRARKDSAMERVLAHTLEECERAPSRGETKQCVGSAEDMIDFAVSVLGSDVVVRTTQNVKGSSQNVMIGKVQGINGGKLTKSVSCHQSLYPYLLYYCHSVPKVRVYEADILDLHSKSKMNHGIAICHIDTSTWGSEHGAFMALGASPGKIEVCHWIFENDMSWTVADHYVS